MSALLACGPARLNGVAPAVVAPVTPGGSVRIRRKSNLDHSRARVVAKGAQVVCGGAWYRVLAVRTGYCCIRRLSDESPWAAAEWTPCSNVRVVE